MYLVHDAEMECDVFLDDDPRSAGFAGEVVEGVSLEDDELEGPVWDHGSTRPQLLLAVAADDPKKFKVFSSEDEVASARLSHDRHDLCLRHDLVALPAGHRSRRTLIRQPF